jgi:hypothetical protein
MCERRSYLRPWATAPLLLLLGACASHVHNRQPAQNPTAKQVQICPGFLQKFLARSRRAVYKIKHSEVPQILKEHLSNSGLAWFQHRMRFDKSEIDPLFLLLAQEMKSPLYIGGGSDLVQSLLGVPKKLELGIAEINTFMPPHTTIDNQWVFIETEILVPAFKDRPETLITYTQINAESSSDLSNYVAQTLNNQHLIKDREITLNVPLKSTGVLEVFPDGIVNLYFRTESELQNYLEKKLVIPLAGQLTGKAWATTFFENSDNAFLHESLIYNLIIYVRGKPRGWSLTPESHEFLKDALATISRQKQEDIFNEVVNRTRTDTLATHQIQATLKALQDPI